MIRRGAAATAWRYALGAACIGAAALVHVSPVGELFHPMGVFILGVVAAGWFGGVGPGLLAAFLSALTLPHLIAITYPLSVAYPLLANAFDAPRFITLGLTGAAVGWGTGSYRKVRDQLEAAVTERTAHLKASEERYARAMEATAAGHWEWDLVNNKVFHSPRFRELYGVGLDETFLTRDAWKARQPLSAAERERQERALQEAIADPAKSYDIELSFEVRPGEVRWLRSRAKVFRAQDGRPLRMAGATSDITVQKRAEEALRASEERYALAVAGSDDGVWDVDFGARRVFASARARELAGLEPGPEIVPMDEFFAALPLHPEDAARRLAAMQAHLAGEAPAYEGEFRLLQRDGVYRWRRMHGICVRDARGKPQRMAGSIGDVDARRRAEDALRRSEERYALALEVTEDGHWDWNVQTDEIFASARALRVIGVAPDAQYRTRSDLTARVRYHPEDWPRISAQWRDTLAGSGSEHEFEYRILGTAGTRWIRGLWKIFRDALGTAVRVVGVVTDITQRKLAEEALRLSEQRYERAMLASNAGVWEWNAATDEYYISPRHLELLGFAPGTTFASRDDFMRRAPFHPEDLRQWQQAAGQLLASGGSHLAHELRAFIGDELRWVRVNAIGFRDGSGTLTRLTGSVTDITERKRAEEALRLSEERYALAMKASEEGHFDWNVQTDEMFASAHLINLLALPADREYRTRSDMVSAIKYYPGDGERLARMAREVLGSRALHHEFEYRLLRGPLQEPRWIHANWKIFRDGHGAAQRVIGVVSDVTQSKQAVETLRESEARFRTLVELISGGFWEQDENLRYRPSDFPADITGYSTDERIGKTRWELGREVTPLSGSWAEHKADLEARRPFRDFEYRRLQPDGSIGYYSASGAPIFDGEGRFKGYYGVASDITERKRVEEELRSRKEMLELAQAAARAVPWQWRNDAPPDVNRWSPEMAAMFGLSAQAFDGTADSWWKLCHPEDRTAVKASIAHAHATGEIDVEYRVVHPDGKVHWLNQKGRTFFGAEGKPVRSIGFIQDVTERKQAEDGMRQLEQKLRRAQRLEAVGTLAGGIAHDFNNILGAILGYGEMAMRDAKPGTRLRRDVEAILAAGERGRSLVDRILAFSRSGIGERVAVDVEAVVREALDQLAAHLPANVTIAPRLHAGRAAMLGDSTQVHQVVMNLATNGVHAMTHGGVLVVSLEAARLTTPRAALIGSVAVGDYLVLKVKDSGGGIAPEVLERMFDPFFTTKEVGVGSGLGLSLVHGIVANVGGAIDVGTRLGKGSTFTVYLPRSGDAPAKPPPDKRPLARGEGQRVLVVDDEEPLARLATETLKRLGYAPVTFTSSAAALAAFRAEPDRFDAVLTDERMPGLSGSALIREVRGIRGAIPVVLMSGYLGMHSVDANVVVNKPLSARALAASMAQALSI